MRTKRKELTPEEIIAWADAVNGVKAQDTAKKLGVHANTVTTYRKKVAEFIGKHINLDDYRNPLYELYPLALKSLIVNLNSHDVPTTLKFFSGMGLFIDKSQTEDLTKYSDDELRAIKQRMVDSLPDATVRGQGGGEPVAESGHRGEAESSPGASEDVQTDGTAVQ
jgi:hypothetical protein